MLGFNQDDTITARLSRLLRRLGGDRRGNFAMIFALALTPALVAVGAAVDVSRAYVVRERLSRALDAAGLAVGTQTGLTNAQLQTMAQAYFNANYPSSSNATSGTVSVTTSGSTVTLKVTADMPTNFLGLVGVNTVKVAESSTITKMGKKLEVVMVLDTTGSMGSSGKMTALKSAAKNLITIVSAGAVNAGDVKFAIVPFTVDVKVGTSYKTANWIKWDWTTPKYRDYVCTGSGWNRSCSYEDRSYSISKSSWKGCVGDRDMNYDVSNSLPVNNNDATEYPADNDDCKPEPILPLTTSTTDLNNKIDDLDSDGNTNTTIGLMWGWNMLTVGAPLSNAVAANDKLDKIIVYMTDGDNTENRFTTNSDDIDDRMSAVCTAAKADGIKIYTIRLMDGNANLLRDCATNSSMYFGVTAASQLDAVFATIAQSISNLRVSQ